MQRAMLGNITPNIRAIVAEIKANDIQVFSILMGKLKMMMKKLLQK